MNLTKWAPWNWFKNEPSQEGGEAVPVRRQQARTDDPVARLHDEIDRVFEQAFRGFGLPGPSAGRSSMLGSGGIGWLKPSVDISEKKNAYVISVEVPGVDEDDLDVEVSGDNLIIRGEKKQEDEHEEGDYHSVERSYGAFQRVLTLPGNADRDAINARFKKGVLTLTVGKTQGSQREGRRIEVQSE